MAFNSDQFRSNIEEVARPNLYTVSINNAPTGEFDFHEFSNIQYRCDECEMPSKNLGTAEHKDYGPPRNMVYGAFYGDVQFSFIVDSIMKEKELFDRWQNYIVNDSETHDVKYYDDYIGEITIIQYAPHGRPIYSVQLHEAFPNDVASVPLSWSTTDDYHRITVTMSYRYWTPDATIRNRPYTQSRQQNGILETIEDAIPENVQDAVDQAADIIGIA